jgi:hypothetical protein
MAYMDRHRWRKAGISLILSVVLGFFAYDMKASLGHTTSNVIGALALIAFTYGIYKTLFGDSHSFGDAIVFALTPNFLSAITNERRADEASSLILYTWLGAVIAVGYFYFKALLA